MAEQQQRLQALSEEYQKLEQGKFSLFMSQSRFNRFLELQNSIQSRQKLESQQQENKAVQKVALQNSVCSVHG